MKTTSQQTKLRQLDHDLLIAKTKTFDYLHAMGRGVRIRIWVMADEDGKCHATAQLGPRAYKESDIKASSACLKLLVTLRVAFAQAKESEREAIRQQHSNMTLAA